MLNNISFIVLAILTREYNYFVIYTESTRLTITFLLYGSNDQYDDVNRHTFLSVHSFIRNAKRSKYISMKATTCTYLIAVEI